MAVSLAPMGENASGSFRLARFDRENFSVGRSFQSYREGWDSEKAAEPSNATKAVIAIIFRMKIINLVYALGRVLLSLLLSFGGGHSALFGARVVLGFRMATTGDSDARKSARTPIGLD
jgi:hypothetical protein